MEDAHRERLTGHALAAGSPTVSRFRPRCEVRFQEASPFGADDVLFSLQRAAGEGPGLVGLTAPIKALCKAVGFTVLQAPEWRTHFLSANQLRPAVATAKRP